jgi:two-component system response regulator DesR
MIRVLIVQDVRSIGSEAIASLADEPDIAIVGRLAFNNDIAPLAAELWPSVIVINTEYMVSQILPLVAELNARIPAASILVLADPSKRGTLPPRRRARGLSFVVRDISAVLLANAIRRVATGERVIHPRLTAAALGTEKSISTRELEVLGLAAEGAPVEEIAGRLYLSLGTVRNHLSAVITKTGARNRIDAIRIVRNDGWLR